MARTPKTYLVDTHPKVAAMAVDQEIVAKLGTSSARKIVWRCKKGHEWIDTPAHLSRGVGCPYCSGRRAIIGETDLDTTDPEIADMLIDQSLRYDLKRSSAKVVAWRCAKYPEHTWMDSVVRMTARGGACPICNESGRVGYKEAVNFDEIESKPVVVTPDEVWDGRAFEETHPPKHPISEELQKEIVHECDKNLSANTHKKIEWRCSEGHTWFADVSSRTRLGAGCPCCSGRVPIVGENDLATTHPEVARRLVDPELAKTVRATSGRKFEWVCDVDPSHVWKAEVRYVVKAVAAGRSGCPYCSKHAGRAGVKRHKTLGEVQHPILKEALHPELAATYSLGSGKVMQWVCTKHEGIRYIYEMQIKKRVEGRGCPVCANKVVIPGVNDFATTHPELAAQMVDKALATQLTYGSVQKVEWECENGHRWFASVYPRVVGNGCPECACKGTSVGEQEVVAFVQKLVGKSNVVVHDLSVLPGRYELDITVPDKKIAIEYNGLYWHSVEAGKAVDYHLQKRLAAEAAGYQLVTVWEDVWLHRRDAAMRMLAAKLGVTNKLCNILDNGEQVVQRYYARNCEPCELDATEAGWFLEHNHIQGAVAATRHFGLVADGRIVAVMSVRKGSFSTRPNRPAAEWEIQRYATCGQVVGGCSKLMRFAERTLASEDVPIERWVSFSDNDVSDGSMYERCGFTLDGESESDYCYAGRYTDMQRWSKRRFQLKAFRQNPDLVYKEGWTEHEAAQNNGLWRIYDSGKKRWVKEVSHGS